jgi:hypothetical protein
MNTEEQETVQVNEDKDEDKPGGCHFSPLSAVFKQEAGDPLGDLKMLNGYRKDLKVLTAATVHF